MSETASNVGQSMRAEKSYRTKFVEFTEIWERAGRHGIKLAKSLRRLLYARIGYQHSVSQRSRFLEYFLIAGVIKNVGE